MHKVYYYPGTGGDAICLDGDTAFIGTGGKLRSHERSRTIKNRSVKGLTIPMREVDIECIAYDDAANELRRVSDADVEARKPGTICIDGEWNMQCYVVASETDEVYYDAVKLKLTLILMSRYWWREHSRHYVVGLTQDGLDYPNDFEFDLSASAGKGSFTVDSLLGAKPRITFYGAVTNPYITITDSNGVANRYEVDTQIFSGHKCVIDATGVSPTVTVYDQYGNAQSVFSAALRGEGTNAFASLPHGNLSVAWSGAFAFDITARELDTEPPWNR